ncbi:MAG TPA: DoxX family protein [Longimicrobium sp.]
MRPFFMHRFEEPTLALLRVVAGLMFMQHGAQKLFGWLKAPDAPPGTVELMSQMGLAGVLEFFGGLMIVLGLFTRPVAFVLAGQMAFAYFTAHAPQGPVPILNGGELAVLFCFIFFYFSARGGGRYSLDHLMSRRDTETRR